MLTKEQRSALVAEAKSWIGTPYRGWSHSKRNGADCGQLIYGIYRALRLIPETPLPKDYSLQVAQHRASTEYVDFLKRFCREIPEAEALPGDIVAYKLGHAYAHAAIIIEWPRYVLQAEMRHGVSGAHGTKMPAFRHRPRIFLTLRDEYCGGGF